jgi:integrase
VRKSRKKLPVVLTQEEVKVVFNSLSGSAWLMATQLYGSGPRLTECIRSRVKDVDFAYNPIVARDGKEEFLASKLSRFRYHGAIFPKATYATPGAEKSRIHNGLSDRC